MRILDGGDGHLRERLGLYLVGRLSPEEQERAEDHLLGCESCLREFQDLSEVGAMLSLLSDEDVAAAERAGAPGAHRRPSTRPGPGPSTMTGPVPATRPPSRSASGTRPGVVRAPGRGPKVRLLVAAAVMILGAGIGVGVWLQGRGDTPGVGTQPVPVATDAGNGGSLSVQATAKGGTSATVRAVVVGVRIGVPFKVLAVTKDGTKVVVFEGAAVGGPQTVLGDIAVAVGNLASFELAQPDGKVIASVPYTPPTP